jgi:antitoxin PrlF
MNAHVDIHGTTNMTSKGQVLIPKDVRERVGLVPGQAVDVGVNELGQAVVVPAHQLPTDEAARRAAIHASIMSVVGIIDTGMTTDEMMRELRGDDRFI